MKWDYESVIATSRVFCVLVPKGRKSIARRRKPLETGHDHIAEPQRGESRVDMESTPSQVGISDFLELIYRRVAAVVHAINDFQGLTLSS